MKEKEKKEQFDFLKHLKRTDFDSPEVLAEMKEVEKQIQEYLDTQKIDRSKLLTTFNMEKFCRDMPKTGSTFSMIYADFIRYGIVYGMISMSYNTNNTPTPKQ